MNNTGDYWRPQAAEIRNHSERIPIDRYVSHASRVRQILNRERSLRFRCRERMCGVHFIFRVTVHYFVRERRETCSRQIVFCVYLQLIAFFFFLFFFLSFFSDTILVLTVSPVLNDLVCRTHASKSPKIYAGCASRITFRTCNACNTIHFNENRQKYIAARKFSG